VKEVSERGLSEQEVEAIAAAITESRDDIAVPSELLEDQGGGGEEAVAGTLLARVRAMGVGERLKLAMRGHKEVRTLLLRDPNRLVVRFVLSNPKITEEEIVAIANNRAVDEELLRIIAGNREWMRQRQVRLGVVTNPKTPAALALRFLPAVEERDIRRLAKSKSVPEVVVGAARRFIASRQRR